MRGQCVSAQVLREVGVPIVTPKTRILKSDGEPKVLSIGRKAFELVNGPIEVVPCEKP
jgi:hypothetical protein